MAEMTQLMGQLADEDGFNTTAVAGVRIFKATQYQPRQPLCYEQGAIIVGQGTRRVFLGGKVYAYNPDNYLVLSVPLPAECETLARVDKALKLIHGNFRESMDVDKLSGLVNMSPSAFHRAFKQVTASSPIQYVKKIRLDRARSLLVEQGVRVNEAANAVGYESATQFSREFKRHFGNSPVSYIAAHGGM